MSDEEVAGASLPEGIEVDQHSAYFGITDSSDLIQRLANTDRLNGLGEFMSLSSDLLLKQPNLDLDIAAARLRVEAGEMYWLISGPFQLLSWTDPIRHYLGMEDSEGNPGGDDPGISANEVNSLNSFNDPFCLLRMLAIGHVVGGLQELDQYIANFEAWMKDVASNRIRFIALQKQLDQTLATTMAGGQASSLSALTGGPVVRVEVKVPEGLPEPEPAPEPAPAQTAVPTPAPAAAPSTPAADSAAVPAAGVNIADAFDAAAQPAVTAAPAPAAAPPTPAADSAAVPAAGVSIADAFDAAAQPAVTSAPAPAPVVADTPPPAPVEAAAPEADSPAETSSPPADSPPAAAVPDEAISVTEGSTDEPATTSVPAAPPAAGLAPKRAPITTTSAPAAGPDPVGAEGAFAPAASPAAAPVSGVTAVGSSPVGLEGAFAPTGVPAAAPVAAPAAAPVGVAATMAGAASDFTSAFGAPAPAPASPAAQAAPSAEQIPTRAGRVRGAGLPGVHHVVQTGLFCANCSVGVEHHWRICPICSSKL